MERSTTRMNTEIPRDKHTEEERLIDYPFSLQLRQMGINEVPPSSSRKSKKSRYSLDPWIQLQPFEVNRGQQEVSMKTTPGVQQRSNYLRQLSPQGALQMNHVQQEQSTSEEYDPFRTVRSFHRRQRELTTPKRINHRGKEERNIECSKTMLETQSHWMKSRTFQGTHNR